MNKLCLTLFVLYLFSLLGTSTTGFLPLLFAFLVAVLINITLRIKAWYSQEKQRIKRRYK
jgi:hypothetical protein